MNLYATLVIFSILILGGSVIDVAFSQIVPIDNIKFLQTGILTAENQFHISDKIDIREFFHGKIIRISGMTVEGFPYITYSKNLENKTTTQGVIFIDGKFIKLSFKEKQEEEVIGIEKKNNLSILTDYTERVYTKQFAKIDVKIFDKEQNRLNDFNQNYGHITNTNIKIIVLDENEQEFYSDSGMTNERGLFATEFIIPENLSAQTLIVTINAENENSKSSKNLEIFNLGVINNSSNNNP